MPKTSHEVINVPLLVNLWIWLETLVVSVTYTSSLESIAIANGCANLPKPTPSEPHFLTKEYSFCCDIV